MEMNRVGSHSAKSRYAPGQAGFSAVNLLAAGVHGFLPPSEPFAAAGSPQSPGRGLGPIETKLAAGMRRLLAASGRADCLATLWIGAPFTAIFVLACLTLA